MQIPLRTLSSVDAYVGNREWRDARLSGCPLHPSGGCSFARHGSYARMTPRGVRIARGIALRDTERSACCRTPRRSAVWLLATIDDSITVAASVGHEAAADACVV